ncbi:hypothetical protein [Streptomyces sp. NPDC058297]|uniref:hypothetical protein n=1 Tax=Streptomyces sp. NPDC058297 TaxID=3346433 RepID=UPI0036EE83AD
MAVMTHTQNRPSVDYRDLTPATQQRLDQILERADNTSDAGEYNSLMLGVAALAGIDIAYGGEVLRCSCTCVCPAVFDNADPDARTIEESCGFNLPIRQCPPCADRHPAPDLD